jgi:anti-anti-sigma regulatory factor
LPWCASDVLRIFQSTAIDGTVVLKLEGQVREQWVVELRRLSSELLLKSGTRLVLDLALVSFIDADGLELFRELSSRHAEVTNCSLFAAQQLKGIEPKP